MSVCLSVFFFLGRHLAISRYLTFLGLKLVLNFFLKLVQGSSISKYKVKLVLTPKVVPTFRFKF